MFQYTLHFVQGQMAEKNGGCMLIRRSCAGQDVVLFMIRSGDITTLTSDTLSKLLHLEGAGARKTISKAAKIRHLMKLNRVTENVPSEFLVGLETKLQEMEKKRKNKNETEKSAREDEEATMCMKTLGAHNK